MKIESLQNEKVKNWHKLKEKKYRDATNTFLIEEDHILSEALKHGVIKEIITTEEKHFENIPTYEVTTEIMNKLKSQVTIPKIIAVCEKLPQKKVEGPVLFLDGIQDPGNLGTMIRSAVAFDIPNIVLNENTVDLYNPKVIRSTEGMLFQINVIREQTKSFLEEMKQKGYQIIGTDVKKGELLETKKLGSKTLFIIGNEGNGMSETSKSFCDSLIKIPMNPACESLNASISASIIMYEYRKCEKDE